KPGFFSSGPTYGSDVAEIGSTPETLLLRIIPLSVYEQPRIPGGLLTVFPGPFCPIHIKLTDRQIQHHSRTAKPIVLCGTHSLGVSPLAFFWRPKFHYQNTHPYGIRC